VVINGHISAADTDSPDGGTGKTFLVEVCTVPVLLVIIILFYRRKTREENIKL